MIPLLATLSHSAKVRISLFSRREQLTNEPRPTGPAMRFRKQHETLPAFQLGCFSSDRRGNARCSDSWKGRRSCLHLQLQRNGLDPVDSAGKPQVSRYLNPPPLPDIRRDLG